jgi:hypothetical protein
LADDDDTGLPEVFPAAWLGIFPAVFFETFCNGFFFGTFFKSFFLATGFPARLDGDFFDERDLADAGLFFTGFFTGFFAADFAFDGLAERRLGARDLGASFLRVGFERGLALRLAFALDLARDFFTGFEAFLAMVVLLLGCGSGAERTAISGFSRDWGDSGKLQIITCA